MNKKLIIGIVAVLILAGLAWFFFIRKKGEAAATSTPEGEKAAEATAGRGGVLAKPVEAVSVAMPKGGVKAPVGGRPGAVLATQGRG